MHLFCLSKDKPGELEFGFTWLPYWIVHNRAVLDSISKAVDEALPKGLKPEDLTESHWNEFDKVAIRAACRALPYVDGLEELLQTFVDKVTLDPSKAPTGKINGTKPASPLGMPPTQG
jgi:hypothetical protein